MLRTAGWPILITERPFTNADVDLGAGGRMQFGAVIDDVASSHMRVQGSRRMRPEQILEEERREVVAT